LTAQTIAIAGATGQVALALMREAASRNVCAAAWGRPRLDLAEAGSIARFLSETRPGFVINAAAYTAVDRAESEPELAAAVNEAGPALLAAACANENIPLIHISTDYVFDGTSARPYREDDAVAPLGVYGRTKAAGENAVRRLQPQHIIVRTSWVYGPDGSNFLKTMLRLAAERSEISVVGDQHGTPTRAADFASAVFDVVLQLQKAPLETRWGTYHLAGSGEGTTWHGFASEIFRHAAKRDRKTPRLNKISTSDYPTPARRPGYSIFDQTKIGKSFGVKMPDWGESLAHHFADHP
jgi:dTDP-4-dehydrorhamnose reductase